jgi:hypothetical protein
MKRRGRVAAIVTLIGAMAVGTSIVARARGWAGACAGTWAGAGPGEVGRKIIADEAGLDHSGEFTHVDRVCPAVHAFLAKHTLARLT